MSGPVTEGVGQATFTVALQTQPSAAVTVSMTRWDEDGLVEDESEGRVEPSSLVFTTGNWETAQTVTVRVAANAGGYAAPLALSHDASGSDYDGESGSLDVSVEGETKLGVAPGTTMPPVVIDGHRVTMTVEAGVPEGIELDLSGVSAPASGRPEALHPEWKATVEESVLEVLERVSSAGFGLGPAGSRTVVDVTVEGAVPSPGLRLCLPVERQVRDAARGRALRLLHYDGSRWARVARSDESDDETMVCAPEVTEFSPFAVGYADTRPKFPGDFTETTMVFTVDEAIEPVTLPEATGGTGAWIRALAGAAGGPDGRLGHAGPVGDADGGVR